VTFRIVLACFSILLLVGVGAFLLSVPVSSIAAALWDLLGRLILFLSDWTERAKSRSQDGV
jgi:hypothetical protein